MEIRGNTIFLANFLAEKKMGSEVQIFYKAWIPTE